jgi:hypothetical protein
VQLVLGFTARVVQFGKIGARVGQHRQASGKTRYLTLSNCQGLDSAIALCADLLLLANSKFVLTFSIRLRDNVSQGLIEKPPPT